MVTKNTQIQKKINNIREVLDKEVPHISKSGTIKGKINKVSILNAFGDIFSGLFVGGAIGYFIDYCMENKNPIFFLICLILGASAGFYNLYLFTIKSNNSK